MMLKYANKEFTSTKSSNFTGVLPHVTIDGVAYPSDKNMEGLSLVSEYCGLAPEDDRNIIRVFYESTKKLIDLKKDSDEYSEALITVTHLLFD